MRYLLAVILLAGQNAPEYTRETPRPGLPLAFRGGLLLVGRGDPARVVLEDREGRAVGEYEFRPPGAESARLRVTAAALDAAGRPVTAAVALDMQRQRAENLIFFHDDRAGTKTGGFSCQAVAARGQDEAWCLGAWTDRAEGDHAARQLLYRVSRAGEVMGVYPLPRSADERTPEGLSRFPALGLPAIWSSEDGSVWAWLPGDRKVVRYRAESGRLEAWDVPLPKGGPAGVSVAVTPDSRVLALLPVSQDGWRVAPGPSPVFAVFRLDLQSGAWTKVEGLPVFKRGVRLIGAEGRSIVIEDREAARLEWWRAAP